MKITQTILNTLPAPERDRLVSDDLTVGLFLRLAKTGRITFIYRVRRQSKWQVRRLGHHPQMTLAKARCEATALHTKVLPESITLATLLDIYYERVQKTYRRPALVAGYIRWAKQKFGNQRLHSLTTAQLIGALREYARKSPVAANRALSMLSLAMKMAVELGYIDRSPLEHTTPKSVGGPEPSRDRILTAQELKWMWTLQDDGGFASLLKFLLLTGVRISEALEGEMDGDVWHIAMTKNGRAHDVWLSRLAKTQVEGMGSISSKRAVNSWLTHRIHREKVEHFTPHDLRRTFVSGMASLGTDPIVIEKCVNHSIRGVAGIYNRYEYHAERKAALIRWSDHVQALVSEEVPSLDDNGAWVT